MKDPELQANSVQETSSVTASSKGHWEQSREFTLWQRVQISLISHLMALIIFFLGKTIRWEGDGLEQLERLYREGKHAILVFWHGRIFPSVWFFRKRAIMVMTSQNFDGEYIARCIAMHGYCSARGSSSRGGIKALAEMAQYLKKGVADVGFTIDGPRGPRYVAKMGPITLAKKSGQPIVCFHISLQKKIQLNSWDLTQIPLPFTRALIRFGSPISVPRQADESEVQQRFAEMQRTLDDLRETGDSFWEKPQPGIPGKTP
jgi:lysophospholipid acyltransferase (LPLAT)-like uncharacterized protein